MKAPSPAPLYATILPVLTETARGLGYALAVHGTLSRDLDLLAVPWVEDAAPPEDLVQALAARVAWTRDDGGMLIQGPERKPYGRLAWTIPLVGDAFVDLSVCNGSGMRPPPKADAAVTTCVYPPGFERDLSVPCTRCGLTADIEAIANGLPPTPCSAAPEKENTMDFGEALRALKEGKRIAREGWNGKGMWLALMPGMTVPEGMVNARTKAFVASGDLHVDAYVVLWTAQGTWQPGWVAWSPDMLATDWVVLARAQPPGLDGERSPDMLATDWVVLP